MRVASTVVFLNNDTIVLPVVVSFCLLLKDLRSVWLDGD